MRRIVLPLIVCSCIMLSLAVLNQELLVPHVGPKVLVQKDDPNGEKAPREVLKDRALRLAIACQTTLNLQDVFGYPPAKAGGKLKSDLDTPLPPSTP